MTSFHHPQPLTDEHIAILEQAKKDILQEHGTHDMDKVAHDSNCQIPACVAGWIAHRRGITNSHSALTGADEALGILPNQFIPLFYTSAISADDTDCWDWDLEEEYKIARTSLSRAQVTAKAIDRYIAQTKAHFANESEA